MRFDQSLRTFLFEGLGARFLLTIPFWTTFVEVSRFLCMMLLATPRLGLGGESLPASDSPSDSAAEFPGKVASSENTCEPVTPV